MRRPSGRQAFWLRVRRHDDDRIREVYGSALTVRQTPVFNICSIAFRRPDAFSISSNRTTE